MPAYVIIHAHLKTVRHSFYYSIMSAMLVQNDIDSPTDDDGVGMDIVGIRQSFICGRKLSPSEKICAGLAILLYFIYAESGLVLGIAPFLMRYSDIRLQDWIPSVSWFTSIWCLAGANVCHACVMWGISNALLFGCYSVLVICCVEEIGLSTGWPFGQYQFTDTLGVRLTAHLPINVLVLWTCLLYPSLWLSNRFMGRYVEPLKGLARDKRSRLAAAFATAVLATLILACFDVVSEPVAANYGYQLWVHCSTVKNSSLESFVPQPDWIFGNISDGVVRSQQFIGSYEYFNVPIQVSKWPATTLPNYHLHLLSFV
jgi:uncharacterized membrane protein